MAGLAYKNSSVHPLALISSFFKWCYRGKWYWGLGSKPTEIRPLLCEPTQYKQHTSNGLPPFTQLESSGKKLNRLPDCYLFITQADMELHDLLKHEHLVVVVGTARVLPKGKGWFIFNLRASLFSIYVTVCTPERFLILHSSTYDPFALLSCRNAWPSRKFQTTYFCVPSNLRFLAGICEVLKQTSVPQFAQPFLFAFSTDVSKETQDSVETKRYQIHCQLQDSWKLLLCYFTI